MKVIDREFKNHKKEAEVEIELLVAMGYNVEDIFKISSYMVKLIEPCVLREKEKQERINSFK